MAQLEFLQQYLQEYISDKIVSSEISAQGELTLDIAAEHWLEVANFLKHNEMTGFEQLIDLCGVDYLTYGRAEWDKGSGGAVAADNALAIDRDEERTAFDGQRYAVVAHLLSVQKNMRLRLRTHCEDNDFPVVPSLVGIWHSANWYEREAFDLFGILFDRHPDLRRILTDYGFVGHPFRKDFPLTGQVEVRYDVEKQHVVYEPVSIEPRTLVPKVIRKDGHFSASEEQKD